MQKPKMVIFDAGKTLLNYENIDTTQGVRAYCRYLTENPRKLTIEEIDREVNAVFDTFEACRKQLFEVHEQTILKLAFRLLELKFSVSIETIEQLIWENASTVVPVDGAEELLLWLKNTGIRTAVISNLDFSGLLLKQRLDSVYPGNQFEFVIASSDYGIRKPMKQLFQTGIVKTGLRPEEIWYVGDKIKVDAIGSSACGMYPVLYKSPLNQYGEFPPNLLVIENYKQLIQILKESGI